MPTGNNKGKRKLLPQHKTEIHSGRLAKFVNIRWARPAPGIMGKAMGMGLPASLPPSRLQVAADIVRVERLMVIGINGTMIGEPGYIRGAVSRLHPIFNDFKMQHLLPTSPERLLTDKICKGTQRKRAYTADFLAL